MKSITVKHLLNEYRAEIEKQLGYLVNVAKRLKLAAPTWEFSEVYEHEFAIEYGFEDESHDIEVESYIEKCFDVTLYVEDTLKIDGNWIFACAIDHRAKAMTQVDETIEIPLKYSPSNDCCEHCGKKYPRVKSYVVYNQTNNEFKQVGKGCLKQFLGINPASYITMFEAVSKFSPVVQGYGSKNRGGRLNNLAYNVSEMLSYTIHQVQKDGKFVKPEWTKIQDGFDWRGNEQYKNVRTNSGEATLDKVEIRLEAISFFRMNPNLRNDTTTIEELNERIRVYNNRLELFKGVDMKTESRARSRKLEIEFSISQAKRHIHAITYKNLLDENISDYSKEYQAIKEFTNGFNIQKNEETSYLSSFDEYRLLLQNIFSKERTLQANLKTIVSGYGFYLTQMERAKQDAIRKENAKHLQHIGTVGQKSELKLKVTAVKYGEGSYGTWSLWSLEDEAGNKFSKWGELQKKYTIIETTDADKDISEVDASIGSTIHANAMIKDHQVYRDEKITVLGILSKVKKAEYLYETKKVK